MYDDDMMSMQEEEQTLLFVGELLSEIQTLKAEIVRLRHCVNNLTRQQCKPYPFPVSDIPGMGGIYLNHPVMHRYEHMFGEYIPEY
jgi:hypothetical protein